MYQFTVGDRRAASYSLGALPWNEAFSWHHGNTSWSLGCFVPISSCGIFPGGLHGRWTSVLCSVQISSEEFSQEPAQIKIYWRPKYAGLYLTGITAFALALVSARKARSPVTHGDGSVNGANKANLTSPKSCPRQWRASLWLDMGFCCHKHVNFFTIYGVNGGKRCSV